MFFSYFEPFQLLSECASAASRSGWGWMIWEASSEAACVGGLTEKKKSTSASKVLRGSLLLPAFWLQRSDTSITALSRSSTNISNLRLTCTHTARSINLTRLITQHTHIHTHTRNSRWSTTKALIKCNNTRTHTHTHTISSVSGAKWRPMARPV